MARRYAAYTSWLAQRLPRELFPPAVSAEETTLRSMRRMLGKQRLEAGVAYARQLRSADPTIGPATLRMQLSRVFTREEISKIFQASV